MPISNLEIDETVELIDGAPSVAKTVELLAPPPERLAPAHQGQLLQCSGDAHDPTLMRQELLHELFEATAARRGAAPAVCCGMGIGPTLTYAQLEEQADRLAGLLRSRGVGRGDFVAMLLPRGEKVYVTLLAILKAGAAYVPLDPEYPADRILYILADCKVRALVTTEALGGPLEGADCVVLSWGEIAAESERFSGAPAGTGSTPRGTPEDNAYVIYTSGSTGRPKGVPITHRAACNLVRAEARIFQIREEDRVYQGFSIAFDASVEELWLAFFAGATLVAATPEMVRAGPELSGLLTRARVTVLSCVPTLLSMMQENVPGLRLLILGGEACPSDLVRRWAGGGGRGRGGESGAPMGAAGRRMVNTYGPTEATVIATFADMAPDRPVTIGRPVPNYRVYILAENLELAAPGEAGELCISGPGLSRGYLNQPELTAEKFRPNPFCDESPYDRIYRSGDLARWTEEGEIEFLGRIDSQVKLRGFRIELAEIEAAIRECSQDPGTRAGDVVVTVREDVPGVQQLGAYVVERGPRLDVDKTMERLRKRLPAYMLPAWFEFIEELPTLPSGKLDRKRLPAPRRSNPAAGTAAVADPPLTDLERKIAAVWARLLGVAEVSRSAHFFNDLGGHSLLVARAVSELREDPLLGDLSVLDIYNYPTLENLSRALETRRQRPRPATTAEPAKARPSASARAKAHRRFSMGQFLSLYFVVGFYSLQWLTPYLTYVWMIEHDQSRTLAILSSLGILLGVYPFLLLFTVAAKWLLVGRMKAGSYPMWGWFHLRWWLMHQILDAVAVEYLEGTSLMNVYYRMMGANIGRGAYFGSYNIGAFDLVSVGDEAHVGDATALLAYTMEDGMLTLGPVKIGKRCFIGPGSVLRPDTVMENDSRLLHASLLTNGDTILAGETWFGSPARKLHNQAAVPRPGKRLRSSRLRRAWFSGLHGLGVFLLPVVYLAALFPGLVLLNSMAVDYGEIWSLLAAPAVAVMFVGLLCLEIMLVKWALLGKVKPGDYPVHGWFYLRKWFVDQLMGLSLDVIGPLYATMYLNPWYRALGAKMGRRAEISTACAASPDLLEIGEESFIADAVLLGVPQVDAGVLSLRKTRIGSRAFVGNSALLPAGAVVGDKTLIGVLSTPPLTLPGMEATQGAAEVDTAWLGCPAIFLPQRQASAAFPEAMTFKPPPRLVAMRLFIEFFRITLPITLFVILTSLLITSAVELRPCLTTLQLLLVFPGMYFLAGIAAALLVVAAKWLLIGKYREAEKPLWSTFVWRSELVNALLENLAGAYLMDMLAGTPLLNGFFRLLGMKVGKRVYLDSSEFTEFDLVTLGDDATLNLESTIQTHLFEDRVMKMSTVKIGARASVGACSVVLYSTKIGDGAVLEDLSLVMKGESLPAETRWRGTPARRGETGTTETGRADQSN